MNLTRPKGTRDFAPATMEVRVEVLKKIEQIFINFGFHKWEGPTFENINTLTLKSGDAIKDEIYTFCDKAGRELGLRFELTASLARIIASNAELKMPIKAYNYGNVFRYDNPQAGRYREFLQMDVDIFGVDEIDAEIELLMLADLVFKNLHIDNFKLIINDRCILKQMLLACGVEETLHADVCRSIDKILKIGFEKVKDELKTILDEKRIKNIEKVLIIDGNNDEKIALLSKFLVENNMDDNCLNNIEKIIAKTKLFCPDLPVVLDFSLIRGQDYYTGTIFELEMDNAYGIGRVGGGGRYDKLVSAYGGKATSACGLSFGIERIMDIVEKNEDLKQKLMPDCVSVYFANVDEQSLDICKQFAGTLRQNGVKAEYDIAGKNYKKQLSYAIENNYKFFVTIGETEMQTKQLTIKNLQTRNQSACSFDEVVTFFTSLK